MASFSISAWIWRIHGIFWIRQLIVRTPSGHKVKFQNLLAQLKRLNDALRDILPPAQQKIYDPTLLIDQTDQHVILALLASDELTNLRFASQSYARLARI